MTVQSFQPADLTPMSAVTGLPDLPAEMAAIVQWANTAGAAQALVERIVDTPFMPAAFWPKFDPRDREAAEHARRQAIASGTAAVLYGGPLGLNPLQSLANIHVVKGKPGLPAELMVALVRSHGHEVAIEDLTDHRCRVWGRRAGEDAVHRAEFTIDRAKKAGYTSQNAKYGTDPQAMLYARAVSILCRQMAPEVLKGLSVVEEIGDEPDPDAPPAKGRTVQRQAQAPTAQPARSALPQGPGGRTQGGPTAPRLASAAPAEAPEVIDLRDQAAPAGLPPLPGEEPSSEGENPDTPQAGGGSIGPIDPTVWRTINGRFVDIGTTVRGLTGPGQKESRLQVISAIVDRAITKGSDLTAAEGQTVLDNLAGEAGVRMCQTILYPQQQDDAAAEAQQHAAGIDEQIAAARADADARAAQHDAEQAQADSVDPTVGDDPWAGAGQ